MRRYITISDISNRKSNATGCSGWNLTFEVQKWIGDWQYVLGVNLLNQHLALYSMKGCRKRDYPPSLYYQQPWWKYHKIIADYFARLSYILTQGKFFAKILVIHSIESAWCVYSPKDKSKVEDLNKSFVTLSELLCGLHRDYDFGDEGIIEKYAKIENGKFKIKEMKYELIILPPLITLRKSTVKLLKEFLNKNGKIIAIKRLSYLIGGENTNEIEEMFDNKNVCILDKAVLSNDKERIRLKEALNVIKKDVKICDADNEEINQIYYQHRIDGVNHIYFFTNTNQSRGYNKFSEKIYVLNAQKELEKKAEGKEFTIRYSFYSKIKPVKQIYLVLEQPEMYKITVNDKEAGLIIWRPYRLDISEFVKDGKNKIEIEMTNSNRNLLGPHHHSEGELLSVGPEDFLGKRGWASLQGFTDEYSFIKFGLQLNSK